MTTKAPYQITFEPEQTIEPVHTGGSVGLDQKGRILATTLGEDALLTDLKTGKQLAKIEGDGDFISTLTLTPSSSHLIICSRTLSMRIYSLEQVSATSIKYQLLRTLKPHTTPVVVLAVDRRSTLLATGGADGVVKVWDILGGYVTHTFRGPNVLISALHFFELAASNEETGISARNRKDRSKQADDQTKGGFRLASGSQDGKVRVWDLFKSATTAVLDNPGHFSEVRALDYSTEANTLLTGSRDKTLMWWDARTWKVKKVVSLLEEVEVAGFIESGKYVYTGGANGNMRIWQSETGREVTQPQSEKNETDAIVSAISYPGLPYILSVQVDHTMTLYSFPLITSETPSIPYLEQIRRISGTHEEIIDLAYMMPDRSLLALATNSEEVRIVSLAHDSESSYFGADVTQLSGHEDIVVCLAVDWSGHWIATGAKDNNARLWRIDPANNSFTCHSIFTGHAESLGAVALPQLPPPESSPDFLSPLDHPPKYIMTGSADQTVKRWIVPVPGKAPRAMYTRKAHDKDINAIDIGPSGFFASASQDKTVKIWSVEEGEVQGVLRGHKRGVWSVNFAPKNTPSITGNVSSAKGLILTGSGDKTVKIWNLTDYSCLRTFEGHSANVLKVLWLKLPTDERGRKHVQIASAGGDGLVKVWDATTGELETTLDNHEDRVWALAVHPETNMIVSGSSDSTVTFWKDTTSETQKETAEKATQFVEQEQELQNYIRAGSYRKAITLALQLNHPARLLSLFSAISIAPEEGSLSGAFAVDEVIATLADEQLCTLLLRLRDWNTNNRTAGVAQRILWTIVKSYPAVKLANLDMRAVTKGKDLKEVLDGLKVYTERHYKRSEELVDDSYLIEYTLREMEGLIASSDVVEMDMD